MESSAAHGLGAVDPDRHYGHAERTVVTASGSVARPMNPPVATPFFFYLLAGTMIIGGILVITRKNAVHSALALITALLFDRHAGQYMFAFEIASLLLLVAIIGAVVMAKKRI